MKEASRIALNVDSAMFGAGLFKRYAGPSSRPTSVEIGNLEQSNSDRANMPVSSAKKQVVDHGSARLRLSLRLMLRSVSQKRRPGRELGTLNGKIVVPPKTNTPVGPETNVLDNLGITLEDLKSALENLLSDFHRFRKLTWKKTLRFKTLLSSLLQTTVFRLKNYLFCADH